MSISQNLRTISQSLPSNVRLVAVSKFHPEEAISEAYAEGQRIFGESHAQELARKAAVLPKDIEWHFIGHLQTNKVKQVVPIADMIEAVDSLRLLREINRQASKYNKVQKVLLELHIAEEATKYGLTLDDCRSLLDSGEWREMQNVSICGLMMMASLTDDETQIAKEMTIAADFFDEAKQRWFSDSDAFCERSWGMSDDYPIALRCRSTMIRVGSAIFGHRQY